MQIVGTPVYEVGEEVVLFAAPTPIGYRRTCGWGQGRFEVVEQRGVKTVSQGALKADIIGAAKQPTPQRALSAAGRNEPGTVQDDDSRRGSAVKVVRVPVQPFQARNNGHPTRGSAHTAAAILGIPMRYSSLLILALTALLACGGSSPSDPRAAIEDAIDRHLARRSDLDTSSMKVTVGKIDYQGEDQARAMVSFQVGDNPDTSMDMAYDLLREGDVWEVQRNDGAGHGGGQVAPPPMSPGTGSELPSDHPPLDSPSNGGQPQSQSQTELPAGHPPVE